MEDKEDLAKGSNFEEYIEDIYAQQGCSLEDTMGSDDDPELLAFAKSKGFDRVRIQPEWAEELGDLFDLRWKDRDKKQSTDYWFNEHTRMNVFNREKGTDRPPEFMVCVDGNDFGVEFVVRFDDAWRYDVKWLKQEPQLKTWLQSPKEIVGVNGSNHVYLDPGWLSSDQLFDLSREKFLKSLSRYYRTSSWSLSDEVAAFRSAAKKGDADAMVNFGKHLEAGIHVPRDPLAAAEWYRRAASLGSATGMFSFGLCLDHGVGVRRSPEGAVKWYQKAANAGNVSAMYNLGKSYGLGDGVPQDDEEALRWLRQSAEAGDVNAMVNLGKCLEDGRNVACDEIAAANWYRSAAECGDAVAMRNLGICYANGYGVPLDLSQSVQWIKAAAHKGNTGAMINLGVAYTGGNGVPKSDEAAFSWFRKAAENGNAVGMLYLGQCFEFGVGVEKDTDEAIAWYRHAGDAVEYMGYERAEALELQADSPRD